MSYIRISCLCLLLAMILNFLPLLFRGRNIPVGTGGFAAPGWIKVGRAFRNALDSGSEQGGAFAVYYRGNLVVHFEGGFADEEANWPFTEDTLVQLFSTTKALGAISIAHLVWKGQLNYTAPVAEYWPQFAANGKQNITVEQLLSHQAGLPYTDETISFMDVNKNPTEIGRILAQQKPIWEPGSRIAYHGFTMGLLMDQIVRHADPAHRSLSQYFYQEIAEPFGVDAFIGLPACENHRCARNHEPSSLHHVLAARRYWPAYWKYLTDSSSVVARELASVNTKGVNMNNPAHRALTSVSNNGFSTARAMAQLFGTLAAGGRLPGGQTLLPEAVIKQLNEPLAVGFDECFSFDIVYGRGVTLFKNPTGGYIFGAPGAGGQMAYADPQYELGWSYLTNYMSLNDIGDDPRYLALQAAMYEAVLCLTETQA